MPRRGQSDYDPGFVYAATSRSLGHDHTKIGLSRNPPAREDNFELNGYAGVNDWHIGTMRAVSCMKAVEDRVKGCFDRREIEGHESAQEVFDAAYPKVANYIDHLADGPFKPRYPVSAPWKRGR